MENLHAQDGQSTSLEPDPSVTRTATDDERIRCYVRLFDPDILAVQEVDGEAALSRVVDMDEAAIAQWCDETWPAIKKGQSRSSRRSSS
jgi:hypothetical protein